MSGKILNIPGVNSPRNRYLTDEHTGDVSEMRDRTGQDSTVILGVFSSFISTQHLFRVCAFP